MNISKYFWSLSEAALKETEMILKNPNHPKFTQRLYGILTRCSEPKELFSIISKDQFVIAWPRVKRYWLKTSHSKEHFDWWQTVYENISGKPNKKIFNNKFNDELIKMGNTFRQQRMKKSMTQLDLAITSGIKQPDISAIENGRKNITMQTFTYLCKLLNIKKYVI